MQRMTYERYAAGERLTNAEILEAAAEIISLDDPLHGLFDREITHTVQSLSKFKEHIAWPDAEWEPWTL